MQMSIEINTNLHDESQNYDFDQLPRKKGLCHAAFDFFSTFDSGTDSYIDRINKTLSK